VNNPIRQPADRTASPSNPYLPGTAELELLARLRREYLGHVIHREVDPRTQRVKYMAHGVTVSIHPHTIITHDLAELAEALEQRETGHDDDGPDGKE
jgi:hypothetical protein